MLETLSQSPRTFYVHNFMSQEETDVLIAYSTDPKNPYKMAKSTAGTHKSWSEGGRGSTLSTRTSMNAFDLQTQTSRDIKKRAFDMLRLKHYDEAMADGIQILRYELGQAYIAHHDYFPTGQSTDHNWDPLTGGSNRWATVFLYLSDVEYGGQTVFPDADRLTNETSAELVKRLGSSPSQEQINKLLKDANLGPGSWEAQLIQKCYTKFAVPPRKGDAILFYSQHPDGRLDPRSLHGACPVLTGAKWGANLWVWNACRFGQCQKDPLNPAGEAQL
jgi:prolyl 4-hydroxylase